MAQTAHERTSWVLTVPFHASTDQVLGQDSAKALFDLDVFGARGQFRAPQALLVIVENQSEDVAIQSVSFHDSPDGVTFSPAADTDVTPALPLVALGRTGGRVVLNGEARYLQVRGRVNTSGKTGRIRVTLSQISDGHPIEEKS